MVQNEFFKPLLVPHFLADFLVVFISSISVQCFFLKISFYKLLCFGFVALIFPFLRFLPHCVCQLPPAPIWRAPTRQVWSYFGPFPGAPPTLVSLACRHPLSNHLSANSSSCVYFFRGGRFPQKLWQRHAD